MGPRERSGWTPDDVLDAIHAWQQRFGQPPAVVDWAPALARRAGKPEKAELFERERGWPHARVVARVFGTWNAALAAAGAPTTRQGVNRSTSRHQAALASDPSATTDEWTRDSILAAIRHHHARTGRWPTSHEWRHADPTGQRPAVSVVERRFGTWAAALQAAGGDPLRVGETRVARERRDAIVALLAEHPRMTGREIGRRLGISESRALAHVRWLVARGLLPESERRGKARQR